MPTSCSPATSSNTSRPATAATRISRDWPATLARLDRVKADALVPGRGDALVGVDTVAEGIALTRDFLRDTYEPVKRGVARGALAEGVLRRGDRGHAPRNTAAGRSSSTASPSTSPAPTTRPRASTPRASGRPSATAPCGPRCRGDVRAWDQSPLRRSQGRVPAGGGSRRARPAGSAASPRRCGLLSARRVGPCVTSKASKPTRRMQGIWSDEHVADGAQLAGEAVLLAQQARGGEGAAVGELREARARSGRSAAGRRRCRRWLSPASSSRPSGALRTASASRSASQRFFGDDRRARRAAARRRRRDPGVATEGAVAARSCRRPRVRHASVGRG